MKKLVTAIIILGFILSYLTHTQYGMPNFASKTHVQQSEGYKVIIEDNGYTYITLYDDSDQEIGFEVVEH